MNKKPIIAIMYDFDNTLSTTDMEEYTFIPSLGMEAGEFWAESDELAKQNGMDHILSTLLLMIQKGKEKGVDMSRQALVGHGKAVKFNKGVETWFDRINATATRLGLELRHYVISCGLKPMIEGCAIADKFSNIFACDYVYGADGQPTWPSVAINYSSKIQFLYRINKGVEDVSEDKKLNMFTPAEDRPVPFSNMIYVGDGLTDVPSMKHTRSGGGYAVGVYQNKEDAEYLVNDDRVDFYVKADYSEGSQMEEVITTILYKIRSESEMRRLKGNNK